MAGPLDRLREYFVKGEPPPLPPAPPIRPLTPKTMAPQRIPVRDTRDVDPGSRVAGQYAMEPLEDVARAALEHGIPPDLALAMTIRENSTDLANPALTDAPGIRNPLTLVKPPAWSANDPNQIEPAILHAVERASAVAPAGRERQIQAYQGLGKQPAGYNERFAGQDNPYAKAVEEIREKVVNVSPALQALLTNLRPALSLTPISAEHATAIGDAITRRIRHPNLFK